MIAKGNYYKITPIPKCRKAIQDYAPISSKKHFVSCSHDSSIQHQFDLHSEIRQDSNERTKTYRWVLQQAIKVCSKLLCSLTSIVSEGVHDLCFRQSGDFPDRRMSG